MASRKRSSTSNGRRGSTKRRGPVYKKYRTSRSMSSRNSGTHAFVRRGASGVITGNVAHAPYSSAVAVGLSSVVNAAEFAALYDQYVIDKVEVQFWMRIDPSAQAAGSAFFPRLWWYRDYDDSTSQTMSEMRENSKTKVAVLHPDRPVTIVFKPNVLQLIYQSAIANQFKPAFGQWLDMSTPSTTHYGFKFCIDDLTNTNYRVEVEYKYWFRCRHAR